MWFKKLKHIRNHTIQAYVAWACIAGILLFLAIWFVLGLIKNDNDGSSNAVNELLEGLVADVFDGNTEMQDEVVQQSFEYIQITNSCTEHFGGTCVNVRSGPGVEFPVVTRLRNNVVLKIGGVVEQDGMRWYKIIFDEHLRYPERVSKEWYVSADFATSIQDAGTQELVEDMTPSSKKRIVVDRSDQQLTAYDGDTVFMKAAVSTGLELTPTPRGIFKVFKKTPSRYMQGPIPGISDDYYDLPGVPWNLYFTAQGAVIHGVYWHDSFGTPYSHGCVNLPVETAKELYDWADLGTTVVIQD